MKNNRIHMVILFLILFFIFLQASVTTWNGFLFKEDWNLFSTRTAYSDSYYSEDDNIWINGTKFFSKCYIHYSVESVDGFFVGNDINLNISNGFVEFYSDGIPDVNNITIRIFLGSSFELLKVNATYNGDDRFEIGKINYNKKIQYIVSGPKDLYVYAIYNDSNLTKPHIVNYGNKTFIDIDPAYHTTQLKLTKSVVILTYWVIFISILTLLLKFCKTKEGKNDKKIKGASMPNLIKKILPNPLAYFSWIIVGLGTICLAISYLLSQDPATLQDGYGYGSIGLGLVSIGIAFHSLSQAEESDKKITKQIKDSDEKMKALVKLKIREKKDQYENERYGTFCEICEKVQKGEDVKHLLGSIAYEGGLFIEEMRLFERWLDDEDKKRIVEYLYNLIDTLLADPSLLLNSDVEEYLKTIDKAIDVGIIKGDEKDLIEFIEILTREKNNEGSIKKYIEQELKNIKKLDSNELYKKNIPEIKKEKSSGKKNDKQN